MDYAQPTDCPYYLITRASLSLAGILKKELAAIPVATIKTAYLGVLMCLWDQDGAPRDAAAPQQGKPEQGELEQGKTEGMKIKDLCRCAGVEPSTMTGLIDRMENDGLILRISAPDDRRALNVKLTPAGATIREETFAVVNRILEGALAGIDENELTATKRTLRKILTNIGEG